MSRKTDALLGLQRSAERATGELHGIVLDLERLADELGWPHRAQALELRRTADRLTAAAGLLTAEVRVSAFASVGPVATVVRAGLVSAGALVLGLVTGIGEGAGSELYDDIRGRSDVAVACLAEAEQHVSVLVEVEADDTASQLPEAFVLTGRVTGWVASYSDDRGMQQVDEFDSKADATDRAIAIVSERGGGEVTVFDEAGLEVRRMIVHETGSAEESGSESQDR